MAVRSLALVIALGWSSSLNAQQPAPQAWLAQSDRHAQPLVKALAAFNPEPFSMFGVVEYDELVTDLGPDREMRLRAAVSAAQAELQQKLPQERDAERWHDP